MEENIKGEDDDPVSVSLLLPFLFLEDQRAPKMEENIDENLEQCSSSTVRRKRSTSTVWDGFDKLPPGADGKKWAKCNYCGQKYRRESGTSSLLRHNCPNKDPHDFHPSIEIDQERYRQKMAMAIIKHNYHFKFVEHEGIRDIHSYLNPASKSVSRNTAKADVLKLFEREKVNLKGELESVASKICLTSDLWSSLTSDGYFEYSNLSFMARDILSIPITTVASESAFSIGGRIVDKYRSSIIPKNVEALLCTRDWQYNATGEQNIVVEDLEEEEEELVEDFGERVAALGTI